jgi:hypothetical protein
MTNEELDEARAKEAVRLFDYVEDGYSLVGHGRVAIANIAARLARENWAPPEPVDPDVLAFREWIISMPGTPLYREEVLAGKWDRGVSALGFLAGARMAREQEQERNFVETAR